MFSWLFFICLFDLGVLWTATFYIYIILYISYYYSLHPLSSICSLLNSRLLSAVTQPGLGCICSPVRLGSHLWGCILFIGEPNHQWAALPTETRGKKSLILFFTIALHRTAWYCGIMQVGMCGNAVLSLACQETPNEVNLAWLWHRHRKSLLHLQPRYCCTPARFPLHLQPSHLCTHSQSLCCTST